MQVFMAILQAVITGIVGALLSAGYIKASAPVPQAVATAGLSSTGLFVIAALLVAFWLTTHPKLGNLFGKLSENLKAWIREAVNPTPTPTPAPVPTPVPAPAPVAASETPAPPLITS